MKKLSYLMVVIGILSFAACEKNDQANPEKENLVSPVPISVQHGMLVFDSQETFDETLKMLEAMSAEERKAWEEGLGFKSYDRLVSEIVDAEIAYHNKFEDLPFEEQQALFTSGVYKKHSDLTKEYLDKGIAKIVLDKNVEEHLDFVHLIHSKVVNENGFYKVGSRIMQYTEKKFKAIDSGDFGKIRELSKKTKASDGVDDDIFVSDISVYRIDDEIIDPGDGGGSGGGGGYPDPPMTYHNFSWSDRANVSKTFSKQKIVLFEYFAQHSYSSTTFRTYYDIYIRAEKKDFWGNWVFDDTRLWLDGWAQIEDDETNPYVTVDLNDKHGSHHTEIIYSRILPKGTYPYHFLPWVPNSDWKATRWGGPSGIWIRVEDHDRRVTTNP